MPKHGDDRSGNLGRMDAAVGAGPGPSTFEPAQQRLWRCDAGCCRLQDPIEQWVPDHPVIVTTEPRLVATVDGQTNGELHQTGEAQ